MRIKIPKYSQVTRLQTSGATSKSVRDLLAKVVNRRDVQSRHLYSHKVNQKKVSYLSIFTLLFNSTHHHHHHHSVPLQSGPPISVRNDDIMGSIPSISSHIRNPHSLYLSVQRFCKISAFRSADN